MFSLLPASFNLSTAIIMSYNYSDDLPAEAKSRYLAKLKLVGLDKCPYRLPGDVWKNNPMEWPDILSAQIVIYLLKFPRLYSLEAMENMKSLESYRFFVSGWVQTVEHFKPTGSTFVFRAAVKPSYRVNEEPHQPWVATNNDGNVIAGHCTCMAGLGETCSHVGALLFKLEAAVRLGYTTEACTDVPCAWNACFVKDVQPAKIKDINFYTDQSKAKINSTPRRKPFDPATMEEQQRLLSGLASTGRKIIGLSAFPQYAEMFIPKKMPPPKQKLPKSLRSLYQPDMTFSSPLELAEYCEKVIMDLSVTVAEVSYLEEVTKTQSSSQHWHEYRAGRITSSSAHSYLHTDISNPAPSLIKQTCTVANKNLNVPAIMWGRDKENVAFKTYENFICGTPLPTNFPHPNVVYSTEKSLTSHDEATLSSSGLVISPKFLQFGASPDGILFCKCHGKGILEIKCPFKYKDTGVKYATGQRDFYLDENFTLKRRHSYYSQVQFQMFVCDLLYADLFVWTPLDCSVTRVVKDNDFIDTMLLKLQQIWKKFILPELVTRKLETKAKMAEQSPSTIASSSSSTDKHCICKSPEEGIMIACDSCDTWYHLGCLKLKRVPKANKWYCPACRKAGKSKTNIDK